MIPDLAIIISIYCVMRLLWSIEHARVGSAGKPNILFTVFSYMAIALIVLVLLDILLIGVPK